MQCRDGTNYIYIKREEVSGRSKYRWLRVDEKDKRDKDTGNETFLEIPCVKQPCPASAVTTTLEQSIQATKGGLCDGVDVGLRTEASEIVPYLRNPRLCRAILTPSFDSL